MGLMTKAKNVETLSSLSIVILLLYTAEQQRG